MLRVFKIFFALSGQTNLESNKICQNEDIFNQFMLIKSKMADFYALYTYKMGNNKLFSVGVPHNVFINLVLATKQQS